MLLKNSYFCTTHKSSVSKGFTEQIMPILCILCFNSSLKVKVKAKVTSRLAVYRQSVCLGIKPLETNDQSFSPTEPLRYESLCNNLSDKMCLSGMNTLGLSSSVHFAHIAFYWKNAFVLCTSPLSVQALWSRSCLSYISYAAVAAYVKVKVKVTLQLMVSQSCCWAPSRSHDQIFISVWQLQSCLCGALSLTRGWLCLLSESLSAVISHFSSCKRYLQFYMLYMVINVYTIRTGPLSVQAQYSRLCPISSSFHYNSSLVTFERCYIASSQNTENIASNSSSTLV
jgi:hypothetical protein